jgi:hypothetical protein
VASEVDLDSIGSHDQTLSRADQIGIELDAPGDHVAALDMQRARAGRKRK